MTAESFVMAIQKIFFKMNQCFRLHMKFCIYLLRNTRNFSLINIDHDKAMLAEMGVKYSEKFLA